MQSFWCPDHELHDPGELRPPPGSSEHYYSEMAERGRLLLAAVRNSGLGPVTAVSADEEIAVRAATTVHDAEMVTFLRFVHGRFRAMGHWPADRPAVPDTFPHTSDHFPDRSDSPWAELGRRCSDTAAPVFEGTWRAATGAACVALAAADHVATGATAAYALCRPPGHHAGRARFGGFCYLNNAAIAAQHLTMKGRRVAIVDVDLHHGNGTQDIFWDRPDVLYASVHADPSFEYPYFAGFADEQGATGAIGATFNVPLPTGCQPAEYLEALTRITDVVEAFGADVLVVSLGTDTHADDPIGTFELTASAFPAIGALLAQLGLPTVVVQEGGYHLPSLGDSVVGTLRAWA